MKVLLVSTYLDSPVDNVLVPLWRELRRTGIDASLCRLDEQESMWHVWSSNRPDVVHGGFHGLNLTTISPRPLMSCNVWALANEKSYALCKQWDLLIASNAMLVQQLGYVAGLTNVRLIPQIFDHSKFTPQPPPPGPFKVGVFGSTCPTKRFHIVEEACRLADVEYVPTIFPADATDYTLDPATDVYAKVHAIAHASFLDPSSVVCQEAMLCGRPVLTTRNCGMRELLEDGEGGYFYDGSPTDLAAKIRTLKLNWERQAYLAPIVRNRLLSVKDGAEMYVKAWQESLSTCAK